MYDFAAGSGADGALDNDHADIGDSQQRAIQHVPADILLEGVCVLLV